MSLGGGRSPAQREGPRLAGGLPCTTAEATTPPPWTWNHRMSPVPAVWSRIFSPRQNPVSAMVQFGGTAYRTGSSRAGPRRTWAPLPYVTAVKAADDADAAQCGATGT